MAKQIDDETMENVCILAKLSLTEEEKEKAKKDMQEMLDYVDKLDELDTSSVEPMSHIFGDQNVFREDEVTNGDNSEAMLAALCNTQGATEIALGGNINLENPLKITQPVAVNGNGHELTVTKDITGVSGYGNAVTVEAGAPA